MPLLRSAIKKMKQDVNRTKRNNVFRNRMKSDMKEVLKGVRDKSESVSELLKKAYSSIDIAAKKRLIKKNNAARKKARLARLAQGVQPKA